MTKIPSPPPGKSIQKRKIAFIVRSSQQGGIESHVYELLKHSLNVGYDPILISLANIPADRKFVDLGIKIVYMNDNYIGSLNSFLIIYSLFRTLKDIRPDLIHCHSTRPIIIGSIAARLAGFRNIIITMHNSYKLMTYDNNCRSKFFLLLVSKIMHYIGFLLSRKILVVSKKLSDEILNGFSFFPFFSRLISARINIILNGVDTARFKKTVVSDEKDLNANPDMNAHIIGTIGRLDPMKGIHLLLHAAKSLADKNLPYELVIAGDGRSKDELKQLSADLGIDEHVHFLGFRDDPERIYNLMDIFVLPSLSEGFGLVILEAMACGVPVVTTDVGCAREVIINFSNGIIIPANDVEAMAREIEYLLCNEEKRLIMGKEGENTVALNFSNVQMVNAIFSVYREILPDS